MPGHIELLLRAIAAAVALPGTDSMVVLVLAGVVGLAGCGIVLAARALVGVVSSWFGAADTERMSAATDIPLLSSQSDPDAAGRPRPRAPELCPSVAGL